MHIYYQCVVIVVLLCSGPLLQGCQSRLHVHREASSPQAVSQADVSPHPEVSGPLAPPAARLPLAVYRSGTHQVPYSPVSFSIWPVSIATGISHLVRPTPQLTAIPASSHVVLPRYMPMHASSYIFIMASGESILFKQLYGKWKAVVPACSHTYTSQYTFPVVGPRDIDSFLTWLQKQDFRTTKAHIHMLHTSQPPYDLCVYLGKISLLGGMRTPPFQANGQALSSVIFGASAWKKYFGEVGEEPPLPRDMDRILYGVCPFWSGKKVKETHLLVLIPTSVNNHAFSLHLLGELIRSPKGSGHRTQYDYYARRLKTQIGAVSPDHSYWVLMTRNVLADSRNKAYAEQKKMIACYMRQGYALPTALEAATAILLHHVCTGERLFSYDPCTYTRCKDLISFLDCTYPAVVGGFSEKGLVVHGDFIASSSSFRGVACCRKF